MVLGVLRTELKVLQTDTALLASTELNEFIPSRSSPQLLTVSTIVCVDIHPTNTYIFLFSLKTSVLNYQKKSRHYKLQYQHIKFNYGL